MVRTPPVGAPLAKPAMQSLEEDKNKLQEGETSGGFVIQIPNFQIHIDPGPGALVNPTKIRANKTNLIISTHAHIDHANDINALIEAITLGGVHKKGVLVSTKGVIEGSEDIPWLRKEHRKFLNETIVVGSTVINEKGPGGSIAFETELDSFVTRKDGLVGSMVGLPDKLPPVLDSLELDIELFEKILGIKENIKVDIIKMNEALMINSGTATTLGITNYIKDNRIKLTLKRPICAHPKSKVAISRQIKNRWHLIGFGVIQ